MKTRNNFGRKLRDTRKQQGLTQERLAELIDRSVEALSNIERGISLPNLETLQRLADALDITVNVFNSWLSSTHHEDKDTERLQLEATLAQIGRSLAMPTLRLAVEQLQALVKCEREISAIGAKGTITRR